MGKFKEFRRINNSDIYEEFETNGLLNFRKPKELLRFIWNKKKK